MFKHTLFIIALLTSFTSNAALVSRLGGLAVYDDVANLTWLTDANYAMTSGYDSDGRMNQVTARAWASTLDVNGVTGWRLPTTLQPDTTCSDPDAAPSNGFNCTGSEMGNLFYNVLGGTAGASIVDSHNSNYDYFSNYGNFHYWSSTAVSNYGSSGRHFVFQLNSSDNSGWQFFVFDNNELYALAVQDGDIGAVPVPAAVWLFCSGFIGLVGFARRKV